MSIQVFHRYRVHQVDCGDLIQSAAPEAAGRDFPFSSLLAQLLGFSFGFGPASACTSREGISSPPGQEVLKVAADLGALAHSGWGEGGVQSAGQVCGDRGQRDIATA